METPYNSSLVCDSEQLSTVITVRVFMSSVDLDMPSNLLPKSGQMSGQSVFYPYTGQTTRLYPADTGKCWPVLHVSGFDVLLVVGVIALIFFLVGVR